MERRSYAEARDALLKANEADPDSPKAMYQLSLVYARLGDDARPAAISICIRRSCASVEERISALRTGGTLTPGRRLGDDASEYWSAGAACARCRSRDVGRRPVRAPPDNAGAGIEVFRDITRDVGHHVPASRRPGEEVHRRVDERRGRALRLRQRRPAGHLLRRLADGRYRRRSQAPRAARSTGIAATASSRTSPTKPASAIQAGAWASARPTLTATAGRTCMSRRSAATSSIATTVTARSPTSPRRRASRSAAGRRAAASPTTIVTATSICSYRAT